MNLRDYHSDHVHAIEEWCDDVGGNIDKDFQRTVFMCSLSGQILTLAPRESPSTNEYNQTLIGPRIEIQHLHELEADNKKLIGEDDDGEFKISVDDVSSIQISRPVG